MSLPTEADFAVIKRGDGETPEVFTVICGIENVSIAVAVQSNDRYRRDCAAPGLMPTRKNKPTGKSLTITAGGAANVDNIVELDAAAGVVQNYKIELRNYVQDNPAGELLGTFGGAYMLTGHTISADANGDSGGELGLNNDGPWTYTPA